jgi:hypothetical protein
MAVKIAALALAVVLVSDSATTIELGSPAIAKALANRLRDPDSMRLHNVSRTKAGDVCGLVSGRNVFGSYSDPVPFGVRVASLEVFIQPDTAARPETKQQAASLDRDSKGLVEVCGEVLR